MDSQELLEVFERRQSVRAYSDEPVSQEALETIVKAGLMAPSGRGLRPWNFVVVKDAATLSKLAETRPGAGKLIAKGSAAICVLGYPEASDTWIEDCALCMGYMNLAAAQLGVASCWIQGRGRMQADDKSMSAAAREILGFDESAELEAVLVLGMPKAEIKERPFKGDLLDMVVWHKA